MKDLIENTADTLQIDKKNWAKVKFGAVAIQQKTSVDRDKTDLTFYVKGEHMGSQDLHLREWGELTDEYLGPAFIRFFEKGDILYGSRRTYLRKVVIAPFEGITSNTTLVIKANEKLIDKRFLPFVMMSEGFTDHSIKNSKGSVNPYINWKDLANYEFLLPPKEDQAKLAELLWAMDEVIEKEKSVLERLEIILDSLFQQFRTKNTQWEKIKIGDIMNFNYGKALKESDRIEGEYPVITSSGLQGTHTDYITNGPGIVVGRKGNVGQVTWIERNFWTTDTAYYITMKSTYSSIPMKFYFYLLRAANLKKLSIATAVPGLNRDDALMTTVYLPEKKEIAPYLKKFESVESEIRNLDEKLSATKLLQKSLINQIF
jgi:type I restriction enzyme S subunit